MIRRKNYYTWERKADVASVDKLSTHCIENRMNIKEDSFYLFGAARHLGDIVSEPYTELPG
jgi:hypothetical protein